MALTATLIGCGGGPTESAPPADATYTGTFSFATTLVNTYPAGSAGTCTYAGTRAGTLRLVISYSAATPTVTVTAIGTSTYPTAGVGTGGFGGYTCDEIMIRTRVDTAITSGPVTNGTFRVVTPSGNTTVTGTVTGPRSESIAGKVTSASATSDSLKQQTLRGEGPYTATRVAAAGDRVPLDRGLPAVAPAERATDARPVRGAVDSWAGRIVRSPMATGQ